MRLVWCDWETGLDGRLVCRLQQQAVIDDRADYTEEWCDWWQIYDDDNLTEEGVEQHAELELLAYAFGAASANGPPDNREWFDLVFVWEGEQPHPARQDQIDYVPSVMRSEGD